MWKLGLQTEKLDFQAVIKSAASAASQKTKSRGPSSRARAREAAERARATVRPADVGGKALPKPSGRLR